MDKILDGSSRSIELGVGYRMRAPGVKGTVSTTQPGAGATRSATRGVETGLDALDEALSNTETIETRRFDLQLASTTTRAQRNVTRGVAGADAIELEVPDAGPDFGQVALSIDDDGAVRWILPEERASASTTSTRGNTQGTVFRIPLAETTAQDATNATSRSVLGAASRRLLKVLVYPITDPIVGSIAEFIARRWEASKRPHRLRTFKPSEYAFAGGANASTDDIASMAAAGPILLFVHGTFSTAHGGFGELPTATMQALHEHFDGRVLAFDHPTLATGPRENVAWLLSKLPDTTIAFDIVCHSRGGLVSRTLAEASASTHPKVTVRKLVLAGTPNAGTLLADPAHMVKMIDRLTTALTLLPGGASVEFLEALVTAVKTLGHGGLKGLDGLSSMCPGGAFLGTLNVTGGSPGNYFAIAANYEPTDRGLRALVTGGINAAVDCVFQNAENDLVVPTLGVYDTNGNARFPVPQNNRLVLDATQGIMHTRMFGHADVSNRLLTWLT